MSRTPRQFRFPWRTLGEVRRDIDDELRFHLERRIEQLVAEGLSREDAKTEALRRFGNLEKARNDLAALSQRENRRKRIRETVDSTLIDIRYALRVLHRSRTFAVSATAILSLGIAATILAYSAMDTLLLRPLPLREPGQLFSIGSRPPPDAQWDSQTVRLSIALEWAAHTESFKQIGGFAARDSVWQAPDGPERIGVASVTSDFFPMLGATMAAGRAFSSHQNDALTAVLSHRFWQRRFGSRHDIVGQPIELDGTQYTIVGVLPPETGLSLLGGDRQIWVPLEIRDEDLDDSFVHVIGRLREGVSGNLALAELERIQSAVESDRGLGDKALGVILRSMQTERTESTGPALLASFAGALILLLVASANVGVLLLARLLARRGEIAVRSCIGATRLRLLRQILTEHAVLWSLGGLFGLAVAYVGWRALSEASGPLSGELASLGEASLDIRVMLFAVAVTLGMALLFGLLPALTASRSDLMRVIREDSTVVSSRGASQSWSRVLVVGQVALSTVLLTSAWLLTVSLNRLESQELGFSPDNLSTFHVQLSPRDYSDQTTRAAFHATLIERIAALPGVEEAATTSAIPLGAVIVGPIDIEATEQDLDSPWAGIQAVSRHYFSTAGTDVVSGRTFNIVDAARGEPVVIVNEIFANRYFPGEDPVGRRVTLSSMDPGEPWRRIVGVVQNFKHAGLDWDYLPEMFVPYEQLIPGTLASSALGGELFVVFRALEASAPSERILRETIASLDAALPITDIMTGDAIIGRSVQRARLRASTVGAVAAIAVLLSSLGLFGVLSRSVEHRRREFGIRMALGASPAKLLVILFRYVAGLAALGVGTGLIGSLFFARYLQSMLYEVSYLHPLVLVTVALSMFTVVALVAMIPAYRATSLSPIYAIRQA